MNYGFWGKPWGGWYPFMPFPVFPFGKCGCGI